MEEYPEMTSDGGQEMIGNLWEIFMHVGLGSPALTANVKVLFLPQRRVCVTRTWAAWVGVTACTSESGLCARFSPPSLPRGPLSGPFWGSSRTERYKVYLMLLVWEVNELVYLKLQSWHELLAFLLSHLFLLLLLLHRLGAPRSGLL